MRLARHLLWVFVEMTAKKSFQRLDLSALKGFYTNRNKVIAVSSFLLIQRHDLLFFIGKDSEIFKIKHFAFCASLVATVFYITKSREQRIIA